MRLEMRHYFLGWLDGRGAALEPFVLGSLLLLLARTTKLGWWDGDAFRSAPEDAERMLDAARAAASPQRYEIGLRMLAVLVGEMNTATPGRTVAQHRKTAISFRDTSLCKVMGGMGGSLPASACIIVGERREMERR